MRLHPFFLYPWFLYHIQYRSKVSYQSRLVSRETSVSSLETRLSPRETRHSSLETRLSSRENHWSGKIGINFYRSPMVTRTFANSNDKTTLMASVKLNMNQNYNTVITEKYIMPIGNISVRWHCKQISVKFSRNFAFPNTVWNWMNSDGLCRITAVLPAVRYSHI